VRRDWSAVADALAAAAGADVARAPESAVSGGCIHEAWRWRAGADALFLKTSPAAHAPMLAAEARGLAELASADAVRVPHVVAQGVAGDLAWLALEWLDFSESSAAADALLGESLAALHRVRAHAFGFESDNYVGRTPQSNAWCADWVEFLRDRRLRPQLALAARQGARSALVDRGERLLDCVGVFYSSYRPAPSLLHGDLWSGNRAVTRAGVPVVFDPACYYGDREADLAMTRLFGGFGPRFYAAYVSAWPLDAAAGYRRDLHNLYHVLNHHNLFGGGYAAQAEAMIGALLAEAGE
jgi:fructosamine-3-kinase